MTNAKEVCTIFNEFFESIGADIGPPDSLDANMNDIIKRHKNHSSILKIKKHMSDCGLSFSFKCVSIRNI